MRSTIGVFVCVHILSVIRRGAGKKVNLGLSHIGTSPIHSTYPHARLFFFSLLS
jgi:hypothetical protein